MAEEKPNIVQTTLRLEQPLHEEIATFVDKLGEGLPRNDRPSMHSVILTAIREHLDRKGQRSSKITPAVGLTEDQRDILAIISDPRTDFLFTSVRSTVNSALEQYRKNFKPKTKTKAARPSSGHERQPTGT